jgi:two-component system, sensor histidine kinase and response regulator
VANVTRDQEQIADVLVVDDSLENLQLLVNILQQQGFQTRPALSGLLALKAANCAAPDLFLLDVNMPGMSGYELCEQLKADPKFRDIPVIFVSGLSESFDKVKAFECGAVDYITKPFHFKEVEARVTSQISLYKSRKRLTRKNQELTQHVEKFKALEKLRTELIHSIIHDLRTPLGGVMGYLDLIRNRTAPTDPKQLRYLEKSKKASEQLLNLIDTLLDVYQLESDKMAIRTSKVDLHTVIDTSLTMLAPLIAERTINWNRQKIPEAACDPGLITRVLSNLIGNALKYSPEGTKLDISVKKSGPTIRCTISDQGPGIAAELHGQIFDKFFKVGEPKFKCRSSGLGLPFCKLVIEAHGGEIGLESEFGKGSSFWFSLPRYLPERNSKREL